MNEISSKMRRKFTHLKPTVIVLRKRGKTYSEIRKIYDIPKSTLSGWLRNLKVSPKIKKKIQERAYRKWLKTNRLNAKIRAERAAKLREECKEKAFKEICKEIKMLSYKDLKLIGLSLYLAEGGRKEKNQVRISNSDPFTIEAIMRFFREVCEISENKIKAKIHLYPQINHKRATLYWSKITKLPITQFTKPQIQISKASKGKRPRNTLPYGTLHLYITNTELTWKIKGWLEGIINLIRE
jgi:hypothetical protein